MMNYSEVFISTFLSTLFLFAVSSFVPPPVLRQLIVFAIITSLPFLVCSLITLAVNHYTRSQARRTTSTQRLYPLSFGPPY
ncbi:hypothetical protein BDV26DRAFT_267269 [Aspergillus bertholletiae]|uniref:Uncharacterized protein n=1 Tax=Aspergillus bertholletiae TaxID=1226010 RepID=A0A5N7B0W5_9EURO|nr:hypothetical protein BDV26DRAFT_267269 [Aspergillus bertholletiae]